MRQQTLRHLLRLSRPLLQRQLSPFETQFSLHHAPLVPPPSSSVSPSLSSSSLSPSPSSPHLWDFERPFVPSSGASIDRSDRRRASASSPSAARSSSRFFSEPDGAEAPALACVGREILRFLRKVEIGVKASHGAVARPTEDEHVAILAELSSDRALDAMHRQMWEHPDGRRVLEEKPLLDDRAVDYAALRKLPSNTLGCAYMQFMDRHGLHAGARQPVRFVDDRERAYVLTRYRQLHDIMHTMYGMNISVEAEVALKLIEFHNTGLPMTLLGSIFGPLAAPLIRMHMPRRATDAATVGEALAGKLRRERSGEESCSFNSVSAPLHIVYESEQTRQGGEKREGEGGAFPEGDHAVSEERSDTEVLYPRHALLTELLPWAWKAGQAIKVPLHCVYVEEWFDRPLEDLRRHCGVVLPPVHLAPHVARDQSS